VSNDAEVDQHVHDVVWHIVQRVKVMHMCSTRVAKDNAEHDGINDWSSVNITQIVVLPQLRGCGGRRRGNNTARLTIVLACGCCCGQQQMTTTATATVTVEMTMTTAAAAAAAVVAGKKKKTKLVTHRQQSTILAAGETLAAAAMATATTMAMTMMAMVKVGMMTTMTAVAATGGQWQPLMAWCGAGGMRSEAAEMGIKQKWEQSGYDKQKIFIR
jgi:hypothetical protein